ncbi:MAG: hypothetical protein ACRDD1_14640 [Planctomycetia bacterium]
MLSDVIRNEWKGRGPFRDRSEEWSAHEAGATVRCQMQGADAFGVSMTKVEWLDDAAPRWSQAQLQAAADALCRRVTYLLEPLQTIEFDARHGAALIRSGKPRKTADGLAYYELTASIDHRAVLQRYLFDPTTRTRGVVPIVLTPEQLETLVDDLGDFIHPATDGG